MSTKKIICALLCAVFLSSLFSGCQTSVPEPPPEALLSSYRDIPGITQTEIDAIEAYQKDNASFTLIAPNSTELYTDNTGELRGYTVLLCQYLSSLFEIPFTPQMEALGIITQSLDDGDAIFALSVISDDRAERYFMTDTVAQRSVKTMRLSENPAPSDIAQSRPPRYVLLTGAMMIDLFPEILEPGSYEMLIAEDYEMAYRMLQSGEADAFAGNSAMEIAFDVYGGVVTDDFFPLTFLPVSIATGNQNFAPIISAIDKALQGGLHSHLTELYARGYSDYRKYRFNEFLTDEERSYLRDNPTIPFASQYMSYPVSFYNTVEERWDGGVFDVLSEMQQLFGVVFELVNDTGAELLELMNLLEDGTAYFMPNLISSPERAPRFLWPDTLYIKDRFALLSKQSYPNISTNDIPFEKIGFARGSAFADMFRSWFPNAISATEYPNTDEAFAALDRGEVNLVMSSQSRLASLTNYYEYSDYKANYLFDAAFESTFGVNKDQQVLVSIIDKALKFIDTDRIFEQWNTRTFDYQARALRDREALIFALYTTGMIALALIVCILLIMFLKSRRNAKVITAQALTLESANARIEAIVKNIPGMVFRHIYDPPNFSCLFVSDGCRDLTGYEPEDMLKGKIKFYDFIHPDDMPTVISLSSETLENGLPYENTFRITTRGGTEKWVWERSRVVEKNQDGTPHIIEGYQTDVTERVKLETAELASRAKSDFLATMSHEIRTPMNSIMGFAELAADCEAMPQIKDYLRKISDGTKWLLNIINDILDISKIEAGKMEFEKISFSLSEVFSRCQSVILPPIKEKGLDLRVYAEAITNKQLIGDPLRLYQILMNLLSNAVKFTSAGTVKLSALIKKESAGKAAIHFEVSDTGIGMSAEQIEKIFDKFVQADSSTTRNYGGTGLGLAIVRNMVDLMGGTLTVESSPGAGSKFCFEITFDTVDSYSKSSNRKDFAPFEKPCFDAKILICDDNPMNQEVVCEHLSRVGVRTVVANNGKAGVETVLKCIEKGEAPFDLILMDIFMPIMDGIEAATKISELNTGTPIVAMTANIMTSELEKYKKHNMPDCLGKPFTAQELWRVLLKYLTPIGSSVVAEDDDVNEEILNNLRVNFVKSNQTVHTDIKNAVASGDITLAHRLAHTLKGSAGIIGKDDLKNAAAEVEALLKNEIDSILSSKINLLETELSAVLGELESLPDGSAADIMPQAPEPMSVEQSLALLLQLEPMLEQSNPQCVELLEELLKIPGSEKLAEQIESYEFESALEILFVIKKKLKEDNL
ncbi:MAG: ATP-binding protein [Oscillospiraceae bacterium]|nr:ATP-binding protein [Oscillospiraceae bacterium]